MPVSERFTDIKFSKSVAGYSQKEVDGFINDILPLIKEQEQLVAALTVKLDALEAQRDEVKQKEQEAYRLLEAAKKEADIIIATAKKNAEDIASKAQVASEVQTRAAAARAAELISDAETKAEKIICAADEKARAMLEKTKEYTDEEKRKAQALSNECAEFEARFKTLVAETAKAFAAVKEQTPMPPVKELPKEEPKEVKEEPISEPAPAAKESAAVDFEIVGGRPYSQKTNRVEP